MAVAIPVTDLLPPPSPTDIVQVDARPEPRLPTQPVVRIVGIGAVAYCVAALLNATSLRHQAERMPLGAQRDTAIAAADVAVDWSHRLGFDRPGEVVQDIRTNPPRQLPAPPPPVSATTTTTIATTPTTTPVAASTTPTSSAPTTTAVPPPAVRPPTLPAGTALRAWFGGDSLAQGLGLALERSADGKQLARLDGKGVISTGLARPDVYDWARDVSAAIAGGDHDVLFLLLGANDAQPLKPSDGSTAEFGDPAWVDEYRLRAAALMAQADSARTRLIWIGLPRVRTDSLDRKLGVISAAVAAESTLHAAVTYVDLRTALTPDGGYDPYCTSPDGGSFLCRTNDGVHFTAEGYRFLAELAIKAARG